MSKLAEAVALHTYTWRYLLSVSAGTQITLMFLKYYLSPSRQMLGQYLILGHDHFHILSNSLYIIILSFYTLQYVTALLNKLQINNTYNKHFLIHTTIKENIHNIDFVIFTDRFMLWLPEKTTCLTQGNNHSMTCYYTHSKNMKFGTRKKNIVL